MGAKGWLPKAEYQRSHDIAVLAWAKGSQHERNMARDSFDLPFGRQTTLSDVLRELRQRFDLEPLPD